MLSLATGRRPCGMLSLTTPETKCVGPRGVATAAAVPAAAAPARKGTRDFFKELGVRPFINAAGTYTAMTASLMPPEVMDAIQYASRQFVMLDELHDKVGERIAALVRSEA